MTTESSCDACSDSQCSGQLRHPGEGDQEFLDRRALLSRMCQIKHKVMVLSGKGGVGKSTVAVNLAVALAKQGQKVGLLDVDVHGPSVPKLLHVEGAEITGRRDALLPVKAHLDSGELKVMSVGFLLRERDDAVIWRGPRKYGLIKQFLKDVEWGELDYLVVDAPPGTGDEPMAVAELIHDADGAIVVTTPQEIAVQDVRRCIVFCRELEIPVIGVVENMSGFTCPKCGELVKIFGKDGGRTMAQELDVAYLGAIPIEPEVVVAGDNGTPVVEAKPDSETSKAFGRLAEGLLDHQ